MYYVLQDGSIFWIYSDSALNVFKGMYAAPEPLSNLSLARDWFLKNVFPSDDVIFVR